MVILGGGYSFLQVKLPRDADSGVVRRYITCLVVVQSHERGTPVIQILEVFGGSTGEVVATFIKTVEVN